MGSLLTHGLPGEMAIVSDDAGQFSVFRHGLWWIHAERVMLWMIPRSETHRKAQQWVREEMSGPYAALKVYKVAPNQDTSKSLVQPDPLDWNGSGFDRLYWTVRCQTSTAVRPRAFYSSGVLPPAGECSFDDR